MYYFLRGNSMRETALDFLVDKHPLLLSNGDGSKIYYSKGDSIQTLYSLRRPIRLYIIYDL